MSAAPSVSVYMTVYNGDRYLPEAIESILNQTYRDFEFVIVDDGSTDQVPQILQQYAQRDPRIRIITQKNAGRPAALNAAWSATRGALCANMDPDDVAEPQRLEKQVALFQSHPEIVAAGAGVLLIDPEGWPISEVRNPCTHEEIDAQHLSAHSGAVIVHPTQMTRREALVAAGGYDTSYPVAQDIDLCLRLATVGKLANLPDILLRYRQHSASAGYAKRQAQHQAAIRAAMTARKRRGLPEVQPSSQLPRTYDEVGCHLRWSRWALRAGNGATARKHGLLARQARPWSAECWSTWIRTLFGPSQNTMGLPRP